MSNLEMITAKIKRLNDKAIGAKQEADDLKSMGNDDLFCKQLYSDKTPHEWVCYKRKYLRSWFAVRIHSIKTWFECKVCGVQMILKKDYE
jgi:hypothetical protein